MFWGIFRDARRGGDLLLAEADGCRHPVIPFLLVERGVSHRGLPQSGSGRLIHDHGHHDLIYDHQIGPIRHALRE